MSSTDYNNRSEREYSLLNLKDELLTLALLKRGEVVTTDSNDPVHIQWIAYANKSSSLEDIVALKAELNKLLRLEVRNEEQKKLVEMAMTLNMDDNHAVKEFIAKSRALHHEKDSIGGYEVLDTTLSRVYTIPKEDDDDNSIVDNGSNADDSSRVKQVDRKANDKSPSNSNHTKKKVLSTKRSSYNLNDNDDGVSARSRSTLSSISGISSLSALLVASKLKAMSARAKEGMARKELCLLEKIEQVRQAEATLRAKNAAAAHAKAINLQMMKDEREAIKIMIAKQKEEELAATVAMKQKKIQDAKNKAAALEKEKQQRLAEKQAEKKQRKIQEAKDKAAALEREKQDAKARAKALEIQKKEDREALKAKIAKGKEEEKQKQIQIQEAKDKRAAKIAMIQWHLDKAAAIEQEKQEAKDKAAALEQRLAEKQAEKQRKIQEAKDKAAALEREKQDAKARAKALEIQKKKDREALKAKIAKEKKEEKQKQIQEAKDKRAAKIAMIQKKIQDAKDKAAAIEQEKQEAKARAKALAKTPEVQKIKEAAMMENIAKKELKQAIARVEHARQVKMEVNKKFGTSSIMEVPESRTEVEDVNVSSIEVDDARDVAPRVDDPEAMKQQILQLQSISELKRPEKQSVSKEDNDDSLFSLFKWHTCLMKDLCFGETASDVSGFTSGFSTNSHHDDSSTACSEVYLNKV